jgi:spermidine synthase/Flp pilus assembly protein TadD
VTAANTAGGIGGSLLAPFLLLPTLGLVGGALACAALYAGLGLAFLAAGARGPSRRRSVALAGVAVVAASWLALRAPPPPAGSRLLAVRQGAQATAAVVRKGARRDLVVDGEPEASTAGDALATERLLALLPLLVHPEPRSLLEVGYGSGITLATAALLPLERVECVEIAGSVLAVSRYFAPHNALAEPGGGRDPRIRIERGDGRARMARQRSAFDVVVANTVHPWSVGATGLYSREYFARIAGALRPGGIAAQWLPLERIGAESLAAVLRTFYSVFPEGALWWGAGNVIALGSDAPLSEAAGFDALPERALGILKSMGIDGSAELRARRIAGAAGVRAALGPGPLLSDDRPALETRAARDRAVGGRAGELELVERIAREGVRADPAAGALLLWIGSLGARAAGNAPRADRLEALAEESGLGLARRARTQRAVGEGRAAFREGGLPRAEALFRRALDRDPSEPTARFGLAAIAAGRAEPDAARSHLERLLAGHPDHAEGWNLLGALERRAGRPEAAARAFAAALEADPFFPEALANAGLVAVELGDEERAHTLLARLRALGGGAEAAAVERALAAHSPTR